MYLYVVASYTQMYMYSVFIWVAQFFQLPYSPEILLPEEFWHFAKFFAH